MQDVGYGLPRIHLLGTWVNKVKFPPTQQAIFASEVACTGAWVYPSRNKEKERRGTEDRLSMDGRL